MGNEFDNFVKKQMTPTPIVRQLKEEKVEFDQELCEAVFEQADRSRLKRRYGPNLTAGEQAELEAECMAAGLGLPTSADKVSEQLGLAETAEQAEGLFMDFDDPKASESNHLPMPKTRADEEGPEFHPKLTPEVNRIMERMANPTGRCSPSDLAALKSAGILETIKRKKRSEMTEADLKVLEAESYAKPWRPGSQPEVQHDPHSRQMLGENFKRFKQEAPPPMDA